MRRIRFLLPLVLAVAACGNSDEPAATIVQIDWTPRIEATRMVNPVDVSLLVQLEVNEVFTAGHLIHGLIDFDAGLADLTNASPTTSNPRNRVIVNGADAYLLTAVDAIVNQLPEGRDIVRAPLAAFEDLGVVTMNRSVMTGALGLLEGAGETRQVAASVFEVELDVPAAIAALSADERRAVPFSMEGIDETIGLAEVTLSDDGTEIRRLRVRINGSGGAGGAGEVLLTVDYSIEPFTGPLTFSEPPADQLADLADNPGLADPIRALGPGF